MTRYKERKMAEENETEKERRNGRKRTGFAAFLWLGS